MDRGRSSLRLSLLLLLLVPGCDRHGSGSSPTSQPKAEAVAASAEGRPPDVRLALIQPSVDSFLGSLEGVLRTEGPCLYVVEDGRAQSRTMPAFAVVGARWDSASRTLRVGNSAFEDGQRVLLVGGRPPSEAGLRWLQAPDESCDASDLFVASSIEPSQAGTAR